VVVPVYDGEDLLEEDRFRMGMITVPLEVRPLPEDPPTVHRANVGRLCDRSVDPLRRVAPEGKNREDHHALPLDPVREIHLVAQVLGWSASCGNKLSQRGRDRNCWREWLGAELCVGKRLRPRSG